MAAPHDIREVEVEVLSKDQPSRRALRADDPFIALVSKLMDAVFTIPGTKIRFGLDPILGLLPGFGDTASALVSILLIAQSARYGVPKVVLARMALNVFLNSSIGAIPVIGDAFSFWFKSNVKNYDLLRKHANTAHHSTTKDWAFVIGLVAALVFVIAALLTGIVTLLGKLF